MPLKKIKRKVKKAVKTITRPIAKVLDKVIPNEVKPFLPYAAAVFPFLAPTAFGTLSATMPGFGIQNAFLRAAAQRGLTGSGLNIFSQLAQEGSEGDVDLTRAVIAGVPAALATPGLATSLAGDAALTRVTAADPTAFGTQLKSGSLDLLSKAAGAAEKGAKADLFSMGKAKALSVPLSSESMFDAVKFAKQAEADYLAELAEFNRMAGEEQEASDADRRAHITSSMLRAKFPQSMIDRTLEELGLAFKDGGRVKYQAGGRASLQDFQNALQSVSAGTTYDQQRQAKEFARNEANRMLTESFKSGNINQLADQFGLQSDRVRYKFNRGPSAPGSTGSFGPIIGLDQRNRQGILDAMTAQMLNFNTPTSSIELDSLTGLPVTDLLPNNPDGSMKSLAEQERIRQIVLNAQQAEQDEIDRLVAQDTGVASFKDGGIMDLGGKEMDMRTGGFIPIGAKERADDDPARLSKNEFVMTADAVRAAGGGSVNKGAKRMYDLMHNLEARA